MQLWRHGDRTPVAAYPTDPNPASRWPQGYGQLTEVHVSACVVYTRVQRGMRQHRSLGALIHDTYITNNTHQLNLSRAYAREQVIVSCTRVRWTCAHTGPCAQYGRRSYAHVRIQQLSRHVLARSTECHLPSDGTLAASLVADTCPHDTR
jgi:hypothetical protein